MSRKKMWLGTQHHAQWVDCPLRGADMSPEGWGTEGTYLSGGGFVRQSQDSHRQYIFEWSGASSREAAETMQAYRDGVYSKLRTDLVYFHIPHTYDRNVLPKRWAHPGIVAPEGRVAPSPLGNVRQIDTPGGSVALGVPLTGAEVQSHTLTEFNALTGPFTGAVWVPIPEGKTLSIVAWSGGDSGSNGLYARTLDGSGQKCGLAPLTFSGAPGVLLGTVGEFDFFGARATLETPDNWDWLPGSGNSGCRFIGNPTWIVNSGVNGGQIGYAATLKEVGDWQQ